MDNNTKQIKIKGRKLNTIESVKREFLERGYILLEKEYINTKTPMKYKCPKHPDKVLYMMFTNFKQGNRCPYCAKRKVDFEDVKEQFKKRGYELITDHFINNRQKLSYRCLKHPDKIKEIAYSHFNNGKGCYECSIESKSRENHHNWKGGATELSVYLRDTLKTWSKRILAEYNYKCFITNEGGYLEIHHSTSFHILRDETLKELGLNQKEKIGDYSHYELNQINNHIKEKHKNIIGVPLKREIHKLFHNVYGFKGTMKDLYEFRERYLSGEFCCVDNKTEQLKLI